MAEQVGLIIQVQADRVSISNDAAAKDNGKKAWLAVHFTPGFAGPTEGLPNAYAQALPPFSGAWLAEDDKPWSVHEVKSWTVWRWREGASNPDLATVIAIHSIKPVADSKELTLLKAGTASVIENAYKLSDDQGAPTKVRLEPPGFGTGAAVDNSDGKQTLPAWLARLPGLPHPLPSVSNQHALLEIGVENDDVAPTDLFFAFPSNGSVQVTAGEDYTFPTDRAVEALPAFSDETRGKVLIWRLGPETDAFRPGQNACIFSSSSRAWTGAEADKDAGRVIDLTSQLVAVASNDRFPNSPRDAGALPQEIANAIDPLRRLEEALPRILPTWWSNWINENHPSRPLYIEAGAPETTKPTSKSVMAKAIVRALNFVAAQVLAAPLDAVGQFECPLVQALNEESLPESRAVLLRHVGTEGASDPFAAAIRVPTLPSTFQYFEEPKDDQSVADWLDWKIVGASDGGSDVLRKVWLKETPTPPSPAPTLQVRILSLVKSTGEEPDHYLKLAPKFESVDVKPLETTTIATLPSTLDFQHIRDTAALVYAAPFISHLIAGLTEWDQQGESLTTKSLSKRLAASSRALLATAKDQAWEGLFVTLFERAAKTATKDFSPDEKTVFGTLITALCDACIESSIELCTQLGFVPDPNDCITAEPLPLSLMIDQLQTFEPDVDDWSHLSGYGLMLRRSVSDGKPAPFVSLAAATLALVIPEKAKANPIHLLPVDPVPTPPSDAVGMTQAVVEYSNAWSVAPLPGADQMPSEGGGNTENSARFVYQPIGAWEARPKLPTLSYGYSYEWFGHLIATGGVLATILRGDNPYTIKKDLQDVGENFTYKAEYKRTVPLATPTIEIQPEKPFLPNVAPLSAELPSSRNWVTLLAGANLRLNRDPRNGSVLVMRPLESGLRFTFRIRSASSNTAVRLTDLEDQLLFTFDAALFHENSAPARDRLFEVDVCPSGEGKFSVRLRYADFLPVSETNLSSTGIIKPTWTKASTSEVSELLREELLLSIVGAGTEVQALSLAMLAKSPQDEDVWVTQAELPIGAEPALAGRIVLDGLSATESNNLGPRTVQFNIKGPRTNRPNFERWVNAALFAEGKWKEAVKKSLNTLQELSPTDANSASNDALLLPDPAVNALCVQLVSVFPQETTLGSVLVKRGKPSPDKKDEDLAAWLSTDILATIRTVVGEAPQIASTKNIVNVTIMPNAVYEIRIHAAVEIEDKKGAKTCPFTEDRLEVVGRFSPAILGLSSRYTDKDNVVWLLGSPAIVNVEAASAGLPDPDQGDWHLSDLKENTRRCVQLSLKPISGLPGHLWNVSKVRLLPQKWNWRGRPLSDKARARDEKTRFKLAFDARDGDPTGVEAEATTSWKELATRPNGDLPTRVIVERDLNWRGGWNLWRFKVELESRYLPFFAKDNLRANTKIGGLRHSDWKNLDIFDQDNGRSISTPSPALVVPLTEPLETGHLTPPLLALFHGGWHLNDNFGDSIVPIVESVRHPYPPILQRADEAGLAILADLQRQVVALEAETKGLEAGIDALRLNLGTEPKVSAHRPKIQEELVLEINAIVAADIETRNLKAQLANLPEGSDERAELEKMIAELELKVNDLNTKRKKLELLVGPPPFDGPERDANWLALEQKQERLGHVTKELMAAQDRILSLQKEVQTAIEASQPSQKREWWPEAGPDPIRTKRALGESSNSEKSLLFPVMAEGPIGYGFDKGFENGLFTTTGFLVRPALVSDLPWAFVKLAFRRMELTEGFHVGAENEPAPSATSFEIEKISSDKKRFEAEAAVVQIEQGAWPSSSNGDRKLAFSISNESAAKFEIDVKVGQQGNGVSVSFGEKMIIPNAGLPAFEAWSHGTHQLDVRFEQLKWRFIAAPRPRPLDGPKWSPSLDLIIQVMIDEYSISARNDTGRWITLLQAPLASTTPKESSEVMALALSTHASLTEPISIRLARLSAPSPARWSQFIISASVFVGRVKGKTGYKPIPTADIVCVKKDGEIRLEQRSMFGGTETIFELLPDFEAPRNGSIERLYALLTDQVTDAIGRLHERPFSICLVSGPKPASQSGAFIDLETPAWKMVDSKATELKYVRFLRVLVDPRVDEDQVKSNLGDLLFPPQNETSASDIDMKPKDSGAVILSVSAPIPIS
jgi:hypothetical protein